jgi:hypothetical protein
MSVLPVDKSTIIYGSHDGGNTVYAENPKFNLLMKIVCRREGGGRRREEEGGGRKGEGGRRRKGGRGLDKSTIIYGSHDGGNTVCREPEI